MQRYQKEYDEWLRGGGNVVLVKVAGAGGYVTFGGDAKLLAGPVGAELHKDGWLRVPPARLNACLVAARGVGKELKIV